VSEKKLMLRLSVRAGRFNGGGLCRPRNSEHDSTGKINDRGIPAIVDQIENYPGFPDGVPGLELVQKMRAQADRFGTLVSEFEEVSKIVPDHGEFKLVTENNRHSAQTVIIATGGLPRNLGIDSEKEFLGRGCHIVPPATVRYIAMPN
jgi:thioredoxin reductase